MSSIAIGEAEVTRVLEMVDDASFPLDDFLPTCDDAAIAPHMSWLEQGHYNKANGSLVLSIHSWLVRTGRHTILIDTCVGNHKQRAPVMPQWDHLELPYLETLSAAGAAPEDIDFVMCSHLHVDHVGWNTQLKDGRWVPTFPNAKYVFSAIEHDHWSVHKSRFAQTVYQDSVLPVVEAGQAVMVDDGHQIDDAMTVQLAPGHTPGSAVFDLTSAGEEARFLGDTVHSPIQIYFPDWSSRACLDPAQSAATRRRLFAEAVERNAVILPAHFMPPHGGRLREEGDAFAIDWLGDE